MTTPSLPRQSPSAPVRRPGARAPRGPMIAAIVLVVVTVVGLSALIASAWRDRPAYSVATPDDLVASAVAMIRNGQADQLGTLFYAQTPEMQSILRRLGDLLGSMQDLGGAVARRFPEEVTRLRDEAVRRAAESNASGAILSALNSPSQPSGRRGPPGPADQEAFQDFAKALFADPFGWLDRNADRLSTAYVSDEQAAVLFDGKPLPPVGLLLRLENGRWYIDLPTNLPGVSQFMPQTRHEYSIMGSLIRVADNVIKELADDVDSGRIGRVDQLAQKAGEKAFGPAAMVFIVYAKEMDVRQRRERAMTEFRKKLSAWADERTDLRAAIGDDLFTRLRGALERLAVEQLDQLVRIDTTRPNRRAPRKVPDFASMPVPELDDTLAQWLAAVGVRTPLTNTPPPSAKQIEALIAAVRLLKPGG